MAKANVWLNLMKACKYLRDAYFTSSVYCGANLTNKRYYGSDCEDLQILPVNQMLS